MKLWHVWAAAIGLVSLLACEGRVETAPTELIHTWHSQAEHLKDRSLEIRSEWVLFGTSRFAVKMYPLVAVEQKPRADATHYTLRYRGEGNDERELGLLYRSGPPQTLQLENRDEVWLRTQDANWLKREPS